MYVELVHLLGLLPLVAFKNFARSSHICFGAYPNHQPPYSLSTLKGKVGSSRTISLLISCTEWKMLLGTTLDISFNRKLFLLIDVCKLFHKVAFMHFMFPKHCQMTLLGLNYKTLLVKRMFINWMSFVVQTLCLEFQCSHKPVGNFAHIWVWNTFIWQIRTLKLPFSTILFLIMRLCISFTKSLSICWKYFRNGGRQFKGFFL